MRPFIVSLLKFNLEIYNKSMNRILIFATIIFLNFNVINSQISIPGKPESFELTTKNNIHIPQKELSAIDIKQLIANDAKAGIDNRYAIREQVDVNVKDSALKTIIPGKGTIWRYEVKAENALGIGIDFSEFFVPEGARLYIYNESKTLVFGAFSKLNNKSRQSLTIASFPFNNAIIEYFEPENAKFNGELVIGSIGKSYRSLDLTSSSNLININCPEGADWQTQKHSVCKIEYHDNVYDYLCSGALINNTNNDGTPYFLTASHCLTSNALAATLVAYFNYEYSTCSGGSIVQQNQTLSGASVLTYYTQSDYTLLLLDEMPTADYQAYFAGWDASGRMPVTSAGIHHPTGLPKCISLAANPAVVYNNSITWTSTNGPNFTTNPNTHLKVVFTSGSIAEGSSGSPLFDDNKRIVGQLHGDENDNVTCYYGLLSLSYKSTTGTLPTLKHFLDPQNKNTLVMNGMLWQSIPKANFSVNVNKVCINAPVKLNDKSSYYPTSWKWSITPSTYSFLNNTTDSSEFPVIDFIEPGNYSVSLKVSNSNGSDSITHDSIINAGNNINTIFNVFPEDTTICGYNLNNTLIMVSGALNYSYSLSDTDRITYYIKGDSIVISAIQSKIKDGSFNTLIKVTGRYGSCVSYDSINLKVLTPSNDYLSNAIALKLGENGPFSNICASTEYLEPNPPATGCYSQKSWCNDSAGSGSFIHHTIWFKIVAPSNGIITIDSHGYDDKMALYSAENEDYLLLGNQASYSIVAANDDQLESNNPTYALIEKASVTAGKTYWLQVDGKSGAMESVYLNLYSYDIEVAPNPSHGIFNLTITNPSLENYGELKVFSAMGQLMYVKTISFALSTSAITYPLDISTYSSGVYFLYLTTNIGVMKRKILLVK